MEIREEIEKTRSDFVKELEETEKAIQCIDFKRDSGPNSWKIPYASATELPAYEFLYETENRMYLLLVDRYGKKLKTISLEDKDLKMKLTKFASGAKAVSLSGKDDWYYFCFVHPDSFAEFKKLALKRKISMKEKFRLAKNPLYWIMVGIFMWMTISVILDPSSF